MLTYTLHSGLFHEANWWKLCLDISGNTETGNGALRFIDSSYLNGGLGFWWCEWRDFSSHTISSCSTGSHRTLANYQMIANICFRTARYFPPSSTDSSVGYALNTLSWKSGLESNGRCNGGVTTEIAHHAVAIGQLDRCGISIIVT